MPGLTDGWRRRELAGLSAPDVLLAAVLAVVALVSVIEGRPVEGPFWLTVPVALVMTGSLAWRVRAPLVAALVVTIAALVQTLGGASPGQLWALAVFLVVMYSVAAHRAEERAALAGAGVVGGLFLQEWADRGSDYLFILLVFGGTWLLGRAVLTWRHRAQRAVAEANDKARLAVAEERLRLARELHDVVAHSLGVIAVQAEAAHAALDHDSELARAPVAAVLAQARGAITEMRQLLGVLRTDDEAPRGPQPGLADLEGLIAGFRAAGVPVRLRMAGRPESLAPIVDLAAYRIVQEGLTNVLKHAGGAPTDVRVDQCGSTLSIEVVNAPGTGSLPPADGPGHGLIGVRERITAVGGELSHGPDAAGGFRISATLPAGGAAR